MKKFLEKLTCKHKWDVHYENRMHYLGEDIPHTIKRTLICKKCGKIKQIKL